MSEHSQTGRTEAANRRRLKELLQAYMARDATGGEASVAHYPLSFSQEGYYIFARLAPESPFYINNLAIEFHGMLDPDLLDRALGSLVAAHDIFRTSFPTRAEAPVQAVRKFDANSAKDGQSDDEPFGLARIDLSSLSETERRRKLDSIMREDASTPFRLAAHPPLRMQLLRLTEDRWLFLAAVHHILFDGLSQPLFARLLAESYSAGGHATVPDLQYVDFARWQRGRLDEATLKGGLDFWRDRLADIPNEIKLPVDYDRPRRPEFRGDLVSIDISRRLADLEARAREERITLFSVLLAVHGLALHIWSGQDDIVVGTVGTGRDRPELRDMLGDITNFLPLRLRLSPEDSVALYLADTARVVLDAFEHGQIPFARIVDALELPRSAGANPIYNTAFLLHDEAILYPELDFGANVQAELNFKNRDLARVAVLDLRIEAMKAPGRLRLDCEYSTDLFVGETIANFLELHVRLVDLVLDHPDLRLSELPVLLTRNTSIEERVESIDMAIAASFTAEPLLPELRETAHEGERTRVEFSPFNQIFQELLDPDSRLNRARRRVILLNLEDWTRADSDPDAARQELNRNVDDFLTACKKAAPDCLMICPPAPDQSRERSDAFAACEERLIQWLPDTRVFSSGELLEYFGPAAYYSGRGREIGSMPYRTDFYDHLGRLLGRWQNVERSNTCKVIALDCDNTLWDGVVGEDGVEGIELDDEFLYLQSFMTRQRRAGRLLVLCSKNDDQDVVAVFDKRDDLVLKTSDISARRVNWSTKSANLKEIAAQLNLSLDAFVFIDDNPMECAEVRAGAPEVDVYQLPARSEDIPEFLRSIRALDLPRSTATDRERARLYAAERERQDLREQSGDLDHFLAGLEMKVRIDPVRPDDLDRVAELSRRTNQFNFTTRRRDKGALQELLRDHECMVVRVSDRFGDYGTVGAMIYSTGIEALRLESFFLSCRALGRGVEHRMLRALGVAAFERGLDLEIEWIPTEKNTPARQFLEGLPGARFDSAAGLYRMPGDLACEPSIPGLPGSRRRVESSASGTVQGAHTNGNKTATQPDSHSNGGPPTRPAIGANGAGQDGATAVVRPARTTLERAVIAGWRRVLRKETDINYDDNFFRLGGNSMSATQFVSMDHPAELGLGDLFEYPTPAGCADLILERMLLSVPGGAGQELLERIESLSADRVRELLAELEEEA